MEEGPEGPLLQGSYTPSDDRIGYAHLWPASAPIGVPHIAAQNETPQHSAITHANPTGQAGSAASQRGAPRQTGWKQSQPPMTVCAHTHGMPVGPVPQSPALHPKHRDGQTRGYCAYAGVRRLDRTGADHAIAVPAPMRLSAPRREIR